MTESFPQLPDQSVPRLRVIVIIEDKARHTRLFFQREQLFFAVRDMDRLPAYLPRDLQVFLIIDGNALKNRKLKTINHKLMVAADDKVFSCAAASILAKVSRDRTMLRYHKKYPEYRFDLHKGYPTKAHFANLQKFGPCKIHRKSYAHVDICFSSPEKV